MGDETIAVTSSEIETPKEIHILQSTPTAENESPDYISNKSNGNTDHATNLSPDVIMR